MSDNKTANVTKMLYQEGITGPRADAVCYAMLKAHSPSLIPLIEGLVKQGYTDDMIARGMRQDQGKNANEAQIANCMAVARHIKRSM